MKKVEGLKKIPRNKDSEIFSELYSLHVKALLVLAERASKGDLSEGDLYDTLNNILKDFEMVSEFKERIPEFDIIEKNDNRYSTNFHHVDSIPLSDLEKRWLRTIAEDYRFKLFGVSADSLKDYDPLYKSGDIVYFDKRNKECVFDEPGYIAVFNVIMRALEFGRTITLTIREKEKRETSIKCIPHELQYSKREDDFLIRASYTDGKHEGETLVLNLTDIEDVVIGKAVAREAIEEIKTNTNEMVFDIEDTRNSKWRSLVHFSGYKKSVEDMGDNRYRVTIEYDENDEVEIIEEVLSFGPYIRVIEPPELVNAIKKRIQKQIRIDAQARVTE